ATGGAIGTGGDATGGAIGTGGSATGGSTGTGGNATGGSTGTGGHATGGSAALTGTGGSGGSSLGGHGGGAAGGTAGGAGTSPGTAGAAGGSTPGCAYKLCESFESGAAGALPTGWTAYNGYGTNAMTGVALASDQAHSGTMSLKSSSVVPGQGRIQKSLAALGATANKHWGRIFYKVQTPVPRTSAGVYFHTTMVALEATVENRVVDSVQSPDGTHQWIYNVPDDSCCTGSTYDWTFDASWHCAEWYVDVSTKSYRFFTDSTEVTSLAFTNNANAKMSSYTAIVVGAIFYQTPPSPFVLWLDDLAIDDAQIGCQ
ncbi:MAG TPA: hypothetical protein VLA79_01030, partial [Polyangia bacterium]|nr:hypothetical protein [Polyangia bacterium]